MLNLIWDIMTLDGGASYFFQLHRVGKLKETVNVLSLDEIES